MDTQIYILSIILVIIIIAIWWLNNKSIEPLEVSSTTNMATQLLPSDMPPRPTQLMSEIKPLPVDQQKILPVKEATPIAVPPTPVFQPNLHVASCSLSRTNKNGMELTCKVGQ